MRIVASYDLTSPPGNRRRALELNQHFNDGRPQTFDVMFGGKYSVWSENLILMQLAMSSLPTGLPRRVKK